jgi:hypothetical protein
VVGVVAGQLDAAVVGELLERTLERLIADEVGIGDGALRVVSSPTGASSRSAASSSSMRRASAAAARVSVPPIATVRLANVKPSVDTWVSTVTVLICSKSRSNSSAAIWSSAVGPPWPSST